VGRGLLHLGRARSQLHYSDRNGGAERGGLFRRKRVPRVRGEEERRESQGISGPSYDSFRRVLAYLVPTTSSTDARISTLEEQEGIGFKGNKGSPSQSSCEYSLSAENPSSLSP